MSSNRMMVLKNCVVLVLSLQKRSLSSLATKTNMVDYVRKEWTSKFESAKIPEPSNSILNILAHVLNTTKINDVLVQSDTELSQNQINAVNKMGECRLARMPVQYIIKEWDFRDFTLKTVPPVFIPRPETEELIDIITNQFAKQNHTPSKMMEIGSGSGAISIALLKHYPKLKGVAIDQSKHAVDLTIENAITHQVADRLNIIHAEIDTKGQIKNLHPELLNEKFDFIVSNPPYIPSKQIPKLEPEVALYEDIKALDGGPDGMNVIKPICVFGSNHLKSNGSIFLETNHDQLEKFKQWLDECGKYMRIQLVQNYKDIHQRNRFIYLKKYDQLLETKA